ncbi:hypothetical protein BSKO_01392 [Bryopsis sp. KO-2023]|nr:hypothetical protein BSKO_01392 [Bryopsis sp. KO-2023]
MDQIRLPRSLWFFSKLWDPPKAKVIPQIRSRYGEEWSDNYGWMEQPDNDEELIDLLREESAYALDFVSKTKWAKRLHRELKQSSKFDQTEFREVKGDFEYWTMSDSGRHVLKRRRLDLDKTEVILDADELYKELGVTGVGGSKISPCHKFLAFLGEHDKGSESYLLYVKNLENGSIFKDDGVSNVARMEWSVDSTKLIYTVQDSLGRPSKAMIRSINAPTGSDECIFEEADDQFFIHVEATKDGEYIALTATSKTSSEVHLLKGDLMDATQIRCVKPRTPGVEYFVEHHEGFLYVLTNETESGNYCLKRSCVDWNDKPELELVVPDVKGHAIEDMRMFKNRCVLLEQCLGQHALRVVDLQSSMQNPLTVMVPIPDWCCHISVGENGDFDSNTFRFEGSSPFNQECTFEYDFESRETKQIEGDDHQGLAGEKASHGFQITKESVVSHDGVEVPLTLAHKEGIVLDGTNPVLLVVYGAYGHPLSLDYQPHKLPLLKRGWVVAYAHVRGGGELGRDWHRQGRMENKSNSMLDCLASIDHLVNKGYTARGGVAVEVHSAGGIIAGHLLNRHPDSMFAAILQMPFVDLWSCMSNPELPLTVLEYEEWGDPRQPGVAKSLRELCPYQNINSAVRPSIFVTCAMLDQRVPAWGPAKWVAKMRSTQEGSAPVLLHTEFQGGHVATPDESISISALQYAFLLDRWDAACKDGRFSRKENETD